MRLWLKILLGFAAVLVVCDISLVTYFLMGSHDLDPTITVLPLTSETSGDTVYLKSKVWGVTVHYHMVVISTSPDEELEPDPAYGYVYNSWEGLFYQLEGDTLTVYVSKAVADPPNFVSGITVRQIEISRGEEIRLLERYKERGLSVF
jgi:hypothetical protein